MSKRLCQHLCRTLLVLVRPASVPGDKYRWQNIPLWGGKRENEETKEQAKIGHAAVKELNHRTKIHPLPAILPSDTSVIESHGAASSCQHSLDPGPHCQTVWGALPWGPSWFQVPEAGFTMKEDWAPRGFALSFHVAVPVEFQHR